MDHTIHRLLGLLIDLLLCLLISLLGFLFLFWVGFAADHDVHTPTTTRMECCSSQKSSLTLARG